MKITEKLLRLTDGKRQADIARSAGLKATQLRDYTAKGSLPRYDIALRLARALGVSVEWLIDDEIAWPPQVPDAKPSPGRLSDSELMLEAARRHRREELRVLQALDAAEKFDWDGLKTGKTSVPPVENLATMVAPVHFFLHALTLFNTATTARVNHDRMPGSDRPIEDFDVANIAERVSVLYGRSGFQEALVEVLMQIPTKDRKELEEAMQWAGAREQSRQSVTNQPGIKPELSPGPPASKPTASQAVPNSSGAPQPGMMPRYSVDGLQPASKPLPSSPNVLSMTPIFPDSVAPPPPPVESIRNRKTTPQKPTLQPHSKEAK